MTESSPTRTLRLGTRGSQLARWQADWVTAELERRGHAVELIEIATQGDIDRTRSIEAIGTQGVFTKAIQQALLAGEVDLAVHSLKDLPTVPVEGLILAAVPPRESPADVLVVGRGARSKEQGARSTGQGARGKEQGADVLKNPGISAANPIGSLSLLRQDARIGTGSLRRQAQLRHARPDLRVTEIRGNVETRLRKLDEGQFDAIVLAEAGLRRLGLAERITHLLPFSVMLPAVGQGALGIECRRDAHETLTALGPLNDPATCAAVLAERALLAHLRGGCMAPVGALAAVEGRALKLQAVVLSADGLQRLFANDAGTPHEAADVGRRVADALLAQGAAELIAGNRAGNERHGS